MFTNLVRTKSTTNAQPAQVDAADRTLKKRSTTGRVLKYALMPEFNKSFKSVSFSWHMLVNLVAQLFAMTKLIEPGHPCTKLENAQDYKLFQIIKLARQNVKFDREHLVQTAMFFTVIGFLVAASITVIVAVLQLTVGAAHAQTASTAPDANFIANDLLGGLFNTSGSGNLVGQALGALLRFYSNTVLIFAGVIFIYIVIAAVVETAQSGTPFGKNFNHTWAPIRLIVAIGLLIPLSSGLNSGQYIVLYLAHWGSDVATQGWVQFAGFMNLVNGPAVTGTNTSGTGSTSGTASTSPSTNAAAAAVSPNSLPTTVGQQAMRDINNIFQMELCAAREDSNYASFGLNKGITVGSNTSSTPPTGMSATASGGPSVTAAPLAAAIGNNGPIVYTTINYRASNGVNCGEMTVPHYQNSPLPTDVHDVGYIANSDHNDFLMRERYRLYLAIRPTIQTVLSSYIDQVKNGQYVNLRSLPSTAYNQIIDKDAMLWRTISALSLQKLRQEINADVSKPMGEAGWLSAPLWTFRVAQLNAALETQMNRGLTFNNVPQTGDAQLLAAVQKIGGTAPITIVKPGDTAGQITGVLDNAEANYRGDYWHKLMNRNENPDAWAQTMRDTFIGKALVTDTALGVSKYSSLGIEAATNSITEQLNAFQASMGCADPAQCLSQLQVSGDNPIVTIANLGQRLFSYGINAYMAGGAIAGTSVIPVVGSISGFSNMFFMIGTGLVGAGIFLGFLIPLGPAFRFYAEVLGWIMLVLQLLLAIPIVALHHLSTRGDGFMGDTRTFYVSLMGLVLRPLLIILGLIAGFIAFTIGMKVFSGVFIPMLTTSFNMSDFSVFHLIVVIFIYAFFVFSLANAAFKMVHSVPDEAIEWIGARLKDQGHKGVGEEYGEKAKGGLLGLVGSSTKIGQEASQLGGNLSKGVIGAVIPK